jgi:hypothetical protein
MPTSAVIARLCGLVGAGSGVVATWASQYGSIRPSALVHMAADEPLAAQARAADPGFRFVADVAHYDGVYYYAMARDPFARGTAHTLIDQPAYRYGHPLHGWLAGLLSAGDPRAVPTALFILSLGGLALAGWALSRLADATCGRPWLGLAVAVTPGLLFATAVSTTESLGAGLVLSALLSWQYRRWTLATLLIMLCCLDKEQYIVVPVGLALWEVLQSRRRAYCRGDERGHLDTVRRKTLAIMCGPLALALWYCYVHATLHRWPFDYETGNLGTPIRGWLQTLSYARGMSGGSFDESQLGSLTPQVLVPLAVVLAIACVAATRMRTLVDAPLLLLASITAAQGWRTLLYPHEIFRTPAVVTVLAMFVLLARPAIARSSSHVEFQSVHRVGVGPTEPGRRAHARP